MNATCTAPIFMVGMGRSGTTVIAEAISIHEELGWFSVYLERCPFLPSLSILNRVSTIPRIGPRLRGKKNQLNAGKSSLRKFMPHIAEAFPAWERLCGKRFSLEYLIEQVASKQEARNVRRYVDRVLHYQGKERLFAKFTGPPRIHYLNSIFADAFYIHVIRDPRAVVTSLLRAPFWRKRGGLVKPTWDGRLPDAYVAEWLGSGRSPVALAAVQWKHVVELTWREKNVLKPEKYLEIRYEDFVNKPHELLTLVFKHSGLSDSPLAHKYVDGAGRLFNMNFKYTTGLQANERALVERITEDVARKAGYTFVP